MRKILPDGCAATRQNLPACRSIRPTSRAGDFSFCKSPALALGLIGEGLPELYRMVLHRCDLAGGGQPLCSLPIATAHRAAKLDLLPFARSPATKFDRLPANLAHLDRRPSSFQGQNPVARFRHDCTSPELMDVGLRPYAYLIHETWDW